MPADLTGDPIGAPPPIRLCADHQPVIRALAEKDHVGDEDSIRVALEYVRQCCGRSK